MASIVLEYILLAIAIPFILPLSHHVMATPINPLNTRNDGAEGAVSASTVDKRQSGMPAFVLDYAPMVWLAKEEKYMPSDIGAQVANTIPKIKYQPVSGAPSPLNLDNLDQLNGLGGADIWLTSREGITKYPAWFNGVTPDSSGKTPNAYTAAIVVVDKGSDVVDAFYFYFHAFNDGTKVLGLDFGAHVGDWEHNMIRFRAGMPEAVYFSQHASSQSFTYKATEKMGKRPVAYIARGSHAVYAVEGTHDHTIPRLNLPGGFVEDYTSRGTLWDPTLAAYSYTFNKDTQKFTPYNPAHPVNYLYFVGRWGDEAPPDDSEGQREIFGQRRYVGGPTGPLDKRLVRDNMSGVKGDDWIWPFLVV